MNNTDFLKCVKENNVDLSRNKLTTVQINIGKLCNQTCLHCHVEAGPHKKKENMTGDTIEKLLELIDKSGDIELVDITGGAPEMNPHFKTFVAELRARNIRVIDRCNLTVLWEPGQEETASFLAHHNVDVVASLPCYSTKNVDTQRGDGVFEKSIRALQLLNSLGYGKEGTGLNLDLVYNPGGAFLPPDQKTLEADYKKKLMDDFGISFNSLYCITNMPIKRFLFDLKKSKKYEEYMQLLLDNFNPGAANNVMCKDLVSISWDGKIFDCDFNQMLEIPAGYKEKSIFDVKSLADISSDVIATGSHCFGCTAGAGSSCGGTTA